MSTIVNPARIRATMKRLGLSHRGVAKKMGLSQAAFSLTLHGKREMRIVEMAGLAKLIDLSISDVLEAYGLSERDFPGQSDEVRAAYASVERAADSIQETLVHLRMIAASPDMRAFANGVFDP